MTQESQPSDNEEPEALAKAKDWIRSGGELAQELVDNLEELPDPLAAVKELAKTAIHAEDSKDAKNRFVQLVIQSSAHARD